MKKILIVDDEPMMLKIADRALRDHFETILASSGEEAVELFAENKPDMVISDLKMPSMSGYELKQIIQSGKSGDVPFIFMTADDTDESEAAGRDMGAADYIRKPIKADALLARVNNIFDGGVSCGSADDGAADNAGPSAGSSDNAAMERELSEIPSWIIDEPLIQERTGIENCASAEAFLSAIDIFTTHISNNIKILENCFATGDIENYTIKSHGLKSTSRIIGAMTLSTKAAAMEKAGNDKDLDYIKREHASFIEECRRHEKIFLEHESQGEKEAITTEEFEDAIMAIHEFSLEEDYGIVESIVDSLMKRALSPEAFHKLTKIKTCLIQLDWDEIRKITGEN